MRMILMLVGVALLCGCGSKKQDARIAELERRVELLTQVTDAQLSVLSSNMQTLQTYMIHSASTSTNLARILQEMERARRVSVELQDARIAEMESALAKKR